MKWIAIAGLALCVLAGSAAVCEAGFEGKMKPGMVACSRKAYLEKLLNSSDRVGQKLITEDKCTAIPAGTEVWIIDFTRKGLVKVEVKFKGKRARTLWTVEAGIDL